MRGGYWSLREQGGVVQRPGEHMSLTWFYHVSQQVSTHVHGRGIVPIEEIYHNKIVHKQLPHCIQDTNIWWDGPHEMSIIGVQSHARDNTTPDLAHAPYSACLCTRAILTLLF